MVPDPAAYPTSGGMQPAIPPITIFWEVRLLSIMVYKKKYNAVPSKANKAAIMLVRVYRTTNDNMLSNTPQIVADKVDILFSATGRFFVRPLARSSLCS